MSALGPDESTIRATWRWLAHGAHGASEVRVIRPAGGIIGGVLGHQVGSGRGNDAATAAGAVAGAAIGANAGGGSLPYSRNVRRCENVGGQASYYEVTYNFRGQDHYIQMSYPPGRTILVNRLGEPRQ